MTASAYSSKKLSTTPYNKHITLHYVDVSTIIPFPPLQALFAAVSVLIADKASSFETTYEYIVQYTLKGANEQISYAQSIVTYKNSNRTVYITSNYHWCIPS